MVLEEIHRLLHWEERHRRLAARLILVLTLTAAIDLAGAVLVWVTERGVKGGDVHGFGDAVFFTTTQLLTVSSSLKNPITVGGRVVDVALELWAVVAVAGSAGAVAAFFQTGDS